LPTPTIPCNGSEKYSAYGAFTYIKGNNQWLTQALYEINGQDAWRRECPIKPDTGVDWESCQAWSHIDLRNLRCLDWDESPCKCPAGKPGKEIGNANCDNVVDGVDFEFWREEFQKVSLVKDADFDCNGIIDGSDFEIWRSNRWITAIINQFAREEGVKVDSVAVESVEEKTWSDTCLECPK